MIIFSFEVFNVKFQEFLENTITNIIIRKERN